MNKKNLLTIVSSLFLCFSALGQGRPNFSTYVYNGLQINPAYAGSLNVFSATFTNRNQWLNVDGAPISQNLTAHNSFRENQIGIGLNVSRDAVGVHEQHNVYGSFAYKIRTEVGILAMGLQGGLSKVFGLRTSQLVQC